MNTKDVVKIDLLIDKLKSVGGEMKKKYRESIRLLRKKEAELEAMVRISSRKRTPKFTARKDGHSEAVAIVVASDWHVEETVKAETVNGLNAFNLAIAKERIGWFFQNTVRLLEITGRDVHLKGVVLALLGDFLSGAIHEELVEVASMQPVDAILWVKQLLASGIEYLLQKTSLKFTIVCKDGNHGRTTKETRHATETGYSLEYMMYKTLAEHFKDNPRVQFVIERGYHTYLDVFGYVLRFHHGNYIRYQGGVGGITIPLNKAIDQWNKAKSADIDVLAHWHQMLDTGNAILNGSLIGYSPYIIKIKGKYERPRQVFFLVDSKRGKTIVAPVLLEKV